MPFPHECLFPLLDLSKPSAGLLCSLSPPFEVHVKFLIYSSKRTIPLLPCLSEKPYPQPTPQTSPSRADAPRPYVPRISRTISSVFALSPQCSRNLSWQAHRHTGGCYLHASVSAIRPIGGAWSGEAAVACRGQTCLGSTSCTRKVVSQSPASSIRTFNRKRTPG